ncbi:hypothetical protein Esti_005601 [Eimeria stiedai]
MGDRCVEASVRILRNMVFAHCAEDPATHSSSVIHRCNQKLTFLVISAGALIHMLRTAPTPPTPWLTNCISTGPRHQLTTATPPKESRLTTYVHSSTKLANKYAEACARIPKNVVFAHCAEDPATHSGYITHTLTTSLSAKQIRPTTYVHSKAANNYAEALARILITWSFPLRRRFSNAQRLHRRHKLAKTNIADAFSRCSHSHAVNRPPASHTVAYGLHLNGSMTPADNSNFTEGTPAYYQRPQPK